MNEMALKYENGRKESILKSKGKKNIISRKNSYVNLWSCSHVVVIGKKKELRVLLFYFF